MRCPSCAAENPAEATVCAGCGEKIVRPARRRGAGTLDRLLVQPVPDNPRAVAAYRYALYGLIPVLGLVLGGLALGFGISGYFHARAHPEAKGHGHAMTGIILGGLEFLTNGLGLFLIGTGLHSLGE